MDEDKLFYRFRIDPLNAENYFSWSNDVEILLRGKGLWPYVMNTVQVPTDEKQLTAFRQKQDQALAYIFSVIDASCKYSVMTLRDPAEVWNTLKSTFQKVSEASVDAKLTRLQNLQMNADEKVVEYANRLDMLVNELASTGHKVSEDEKKRSLLRGLRNEFEITTQVIRVTEKKYAEAVALLIIQESTSSSKDECKALVSFKKDSEIKSCSHCGRQGHSSSGCWHNPSSSSYKKHPFKPKKGKRSKGTTDKKDGEEENKGKSKKAMLTISSSLVATRSDANHSKWIIDSGSTAHMCSDRSMFQSFKNYKRSIQVGNSEFIEASGIGEVDIIARVQGKDTTITLKEVLFVPNILYNLISSSRCRKNGYKIVFENNKDGKTGLGRIVCEDSGETVMCAIETQDGLYEPVIKVAHTHKAHAASTTEEVWHRRLGHMSHEIIDKSIPLVEGLPLEAAKQSKNSPNCNDCLLGKSKKMPRPKVTEARKCSTARWTVSSQMW